MLGGWEADDSRLRRLASAVARGFRLAILRSPANGIYASLRQATAEDGRQETTARRVESRAKSKE